MNLKKTKVLFMVVLSLVMLLSIVGCKQGGGSGGASGTAELMVNLLDSEQGQISVLQDGEEVASKEGKAAKFELNKGVYKVKVSNEQQGSKSYDVYLSATSTLDVKLGGEDNILGNGGFDKKLVQAEPNAKGVVDTKDNWIYYLNTGGQGNATIKDGLANIMVTSEGHMPHSVQLIQAPVKLQKGSKYKISFDIKSAKGNVAYLKVGANGHRSWEAYAKEKIEATGNWQKFESEFIMVQDTNEEVRFEFWLNNTGFYKIDNIRLVELEGSAMAQEGTKTEADENKVEDWELAWSDEFDQINKDTWTYEVGNGHKQGIPGWGNNELQYYTAGDNAKIEDGKLVITAKEEKRSDSHGSYDYTSTRMISKDKFNFKYGRAEIRAKMPEGQGMLPAIWTLGSDIDKNPWPACGEIDIAEVVGDTPDTVHGTVHGPISAHTGIGAGYTLPEREKFSEGFHEYAIEWDEDEVEFYVDDKLYHVVNKDEVGEQEWVYDKPNYFILNVAVGGNWPGNPDETTEFPQTMEVDYIRVYKDKDPKAITGEEKWDSKLETKWRKEHKADKADAEEDKNADLSPNQVVNGTFDSEIVNDLEEHRNNWYATGVSSVAVQEGKLNLDIADLGDKAADVELAQQLKVEPGSTYKLTFNARAEAARDMNVKVIHPTKNTVYGTAVKKLSSNSESYSLEVEVPANVSEVVKLAFELGAISEQSKATTVCLDNVKLEKTKGVNYSSYGNYELDNGKLLLGNPEYHAISYGGFREKYRKESTVPTVEQVKEDMEILEAMGIRLLRTYNTNEFSHAENVLKAITELKEEDPDFEMYVMLGAWIQCKGAYTDEVDHNVPDTEKNKGEIDKAIELAAQYPDVVKTIAVGNEAMVRWQAHYVSADVILKWVNYLRDARENGDIPKDTLITSSDNFAAWGGESGYHNESLSKLVQAVDFVSLHTYPFHDTHYADEFWKTPEANANLTEKERIDNAMERSVKRAKKQYQLVKDYVHGIDPDKPLHIGETGWSSISTDLYGQEGSKAADEYKQKKYYDQIREWSDAYNISVFYFEGFDEPWKGGPHNEGHSEKHFGLFTVDGKAKYLVWDLVDEGIFAGLSRGGNSITKTYGGDKNDLMDDVVAPPIDRKHTPNAAVTDVVYDVLGKEKSAETDSYLAIPAKVNAWEGTCGMGLTNDGIIEVTTGTGDWWGAGLEIQEGVNLSKFSEGYLNFDIKGNTKSSFDIGFQTGLYGNSDRPQTNNGVTFGPEQEYKLTRNWQEYSIPMSELMTNSANLSDVTSLLYVMGANNFDGRKIYIKNVYYTQR